MNLRPHKPVGTQLSFTLCSFLVLSYQFVKKSHIGQTGLRWDSSTLAGIHFSTLETKNLKHSACLFYISKCQQRHLYFIHELVWRLKQNNIVKCVLLFIKEKAASFIWLCWLLCDAEVSFHLHRVKFSVNVFIVKGCKLEL